MPRTFLLGNHHGVSLCLSSKYVAKEEQRQEINKSYISGRRRRDGILFSPFTFIEDHASKSQSNRLAHPPNFGLTMWGRGLAEIPQLSLREADRASDYSIEILTKSNIFEPRVESERNLCKLMEARVKRHPASDMVISSPKLKESFTQMQGMDNSLSLRSRHDRLFSSNPQCAPECSASRFELLI